MMAAYLSAVKITIFNAVEAIVEQPLPRDIMKKNQVLMLFSDVTGKLEESRYLPMIIDIRMFIKHNWRLIAEEDLGGVSELFSGHHAIWVSNEVRLVHNPA